MIRNKYFDVGNATDIVVSNSAMSKINPDEGGSPIRFLRYMDEKDERKDTKSITTGKLIHYWMEDPDEFVILETPKPGGMLGDICDYILKTREEDPKFSFTDKANMEQAALVVGYGQSWKSETRLAKIEDGCWLYIQEMIDAEDAIGVSVQDKEALEQMQDSIMSNRAARELIDAQGENEKAIYWVDKKTGLKCKALIDKQIGDTYIDLKSTGMPISKFLGGRYAVRDGDNELIYRASAGSFQNFRYYRQMGFYGKGIYETGGRDMHCKMIVVETKPPFESRVFTIQKQWLEFGLNEARDLLHLIQKIKSDQKF